MGRFPASRVEPFGVTSRILVEAVIEVTFDRFGCPSASRTASATKSISFSVSMGPDGRFNPRSDNSRLTGASVRDPAKGGKLDMGQKKGRVSIPFIPSLRIMASRIVCDGVRIEYIQKILRAVSVPGGCKESSGSPVR